jgi:hypothetical protein
VPTAGIVGTGFPTGRHPIFSKKKLSRSTPFVILDALFFSISLFLSAPVVQGFCRSAEISVVFPMFYAAKVLKCPRRCNLSGQGSKTPEGLK